MCPRHRGLMSLPYKGLRCFKKGDSAWTAWRLQSLAEGNLSERARRRAEELANDADIRMTPPRRTPGPEGQAVKVGTLRISADKRLPMPGTVLTREYKQGPHGRGNHPARRLRVRGQGPPVAVGRGEGRHRDALERLPLLRARQTRETQMNRKLESRSTIRCAIYTRKSTDEGLEQEFNSLDGGGRELHRQPEVRRLGLSAGPLRRRRLHRRQHGPPGPQAPAG